MRIIGSKVILLDETTSTNDVAKEHALRGEPEGFVVAARSQSKGRGRRGRVWSAGEGQSVLLSAVIRPGWSESDAPWLGALAAIAAAETVRGFGVRDVTIKWPNDVLVAGRKIAGVLVEPRLSEGMIEFAVLGIGLNVLQTESDWSADLAPTAISLRQHGVDVAIDACREQLIRQLDDTYARARSSGIESVVASWTAWTGGNRQPVLE